MTESIPAALFFGIFGAIGWVVGSAAAKAVIARRDRAVKRRSEWARRRAENDSPFTYIA